jgi:hypothetical protein
MSPLAWPPWSCTAIPSRRSCRTAGSRARNGGNQPQTPLRDGILPHPLPGKRPCQCMMVLLAVEPAGPIAGAYLDSRLAAKPLSHACRRVRVAYAYQENGYGSCPRAWKNYGRAAKETASPQYSAPAPPRLRKGRRLAGAGRAAAGSSKGTTNVLRHRGVLAMSWDANGQAGHRRCHVL